MIINLYINYYVIAQPVEINAQLSDFQSIIFTHKTTKQTMTLPSMNKLALLQTTATKKAAERVVRPPCVSWYGI